MLVVSSKTPNALLVTVVTGTPQLPLANATVSLQKTGNNAMTLTTNQGSLTQTDWSGGSGQTDFSDATRYFSSNFGADTQTLHGDVTLTKVSGSYVASGELISSSFDTGSASNFYQLQWLPINQPTQSGTSSARFQVATNNDDATWNFLGPDGTPWTYYTTTNNNISPANNGNRYLRYRMLLSTANVSSTPDVSDVSFTFTSACTPPGQVTFGGLSNGTYTLTVSHTGFTTSTKSVSVSSAWQSQVVSL
jgi:hypothetical protein